MNTVLPALGTSIWPSAPIYSCVLLRIVAIEVRIVLAPSCMILWRPPSFTIIAAATAWDASTDLVLCVRLLPGAVLQQRWSSTWCARREPRCARTAPGSSSCARATQRRAAACRRRCAGRDTSLPAPLPPHCALRHVFGRISASRGRFELGQVPTCSPAYGARVRDEKLGGQILTPTRLLTTTCMWACLPRIRPASVPS